MANMLCTKSSTYNCAAACQESRRILNNKKNQFFIFQSKSSWLFGGCSKCMSFCDAIHSKYNLLKSFWREVSNERTPPQNKSVPFLFYSTHRHTHMGERTSNFSSHFSFERIAIPLKPSRLDYKNMWCMLFQQTMNEKKRRNNWK